MGSIRFRPGADLLAIIPSEYVELIEYCQVAGGFLGQRGSGMPFLLQVEYIWTGVYRGAGS